MILKTMSIPFIAGILLAQQSVGRVDLLKQVDELQSAVEAGDWKAAKQRSQELRENLRAARTEAFRSANSELTESVLNWLPPDTETVIVAQEPFPLAARGSGSLRMAQGGYVTGLMRAVEEGKLARLLSDNLIRLAVVGARQFAIPASGTGNRIPFGIIAYQGCAAYFFDRPLSDSTFQRSADELMMGRPVWMSKGSQNEGPSKDMFSVILKPELLLICNDRSFMSETIARSTAPASNRALPVNLLEWKMVDRRSSLRAIRHYRADRVRVDPSRTMIRLPDGVAGLTLEINASGHIKARMLSPSDPWQDVVSSPDSARHATSRETTKGTWELSIGDANFETTQFAVFAIMAMLGLVFFI